MVADSTFQCSKPAPLPQPLPLPHFEIHFADPVKGYSVQCTEAVAAINSLMKNMLISKKLLQPSILSPL